MKTIKPALLLFAAVLLVGCNRKPYNLSCSGNLMQISTGENASIDSNLYHQTQVFRDSLNKTMEQVIGETTHALSKELPEGALGNFCADACLKQANILCKEAGIAPPDICILNHGGLRASLPEGDVTLGNVYELMPFDNELMIIGLEKSDLDSLLHFIAIKGGAPIGGFRMTIQNGSASEFTLLRPQKESSTMYRVLTSDFLANGGDSYPALRTSTDRFRLGLKVRDALILEIREHHDSNHPINVQKDGRIRNL